MNVFEQLDTQETLRRNGNESQDKKEGPILLRGNVGETKIERARVFPKQN